MLSDYDRWLDKDMEDYYGEDEDIYDSLYPNDEPSTYPEDDWTNYDGWDDMQ